MAFAISGALAIRNQQKKEQTPAAKAKQKLEKARIQTRSKSLPTDVHGVKRGKEPRASCSNEAVKQDIFCSDHNEKEEVVE